MCQRKFCGNISAETNDDDIYNQDDANYYDCDDDYEEKTKLSVKVKFRTFIFWRIGGEGGIYFNRKLCILTKWMPRHPTHLK